MTKIGDFVGIEIHELSWVPYGRAYLVSSGRIVVCDKDDPSLLEFVVIKLPQMIGLQNFTFAEEPPHDGELGGKE